MGNVLFLGYVGEHTFLYPKGHELIQAAQEWEGVNFYGIDWNKCDAAYENIETLSGDFIEELQKFPDDFFNVIKSTMAVGYYENHGPEFEADTDNQVVYDTKLIELCQEKLTSNGRINIVGEDFVVNRLESIARGQFDHLNQKQLLGEDAERTYWSCDYSENMHSLILIK